VVRVETFGAFVELAPGVEGLIHVSELGAGRRVHHAREVVKIGDTVDVTVVKLEPDKRRVGLSLRATRENAEKAEEAAAVAAFAPATQSLGTLGDLLKGQRPPRKR
jgi:small subunit ribosomal protein S1